MFNYTNWCNQCQQIEINRIKKKLETNTNIEELLEEFSNRLVNKYLDPLYELLYLECNNGYDSKSSKEWYDQNYLNIVNPKPDHIER